MAVTTLTDPVSAPEFPSSPAVVKRYKQFDTEPDGGGPEASLARVQAETPKWADVVEKSGAKID